VNYEQEILDSGLNGDGANRVPTLLAGLIYSIQADQAALVVKYQHRQLE
jgi:hypothetical protein